MVVANISMIPLDCMPFEAEEIAEEVFGVFSTAQVIVILSFLMFD